MSAELIYVWEFRVGGGFFIRRSMFETGGSAEVGGFKSAKAAAIEALEHADFDEDQIRIILRAPPGV